MQQQSYATQPNNLFTNMVSLHNRHRMYPQYKAHRRQHPPELTKAVSRILAVVDALGIPILAVPGAEADDVVGTLAAKAERDGFGNVVIVSPDRVRS